MFNGNNQIRISSWNDWDALKHVIVGRTELGTSSEESPNEADSAYSEAFQGECPDYVEWLFRRYRHELLRYLVRLTGNEDDAKELMQETYLRMIRHQNLEQVDSRARALLFRTALNLVRDKVRRNARNHSFAHDSMDDHHYLTDGVTAECRVEWSEHLDMLGDAIGDLPERSRVIFVMSRFRQESYPEIADTLGVTTRTVERHMATAKSFLKTKFEHVL